MTDPIGPHSLLPCTIPLPLSLLRSVNRCCPLSRPETQPRHICMVCLPLSLSLSPALDIFLLFALFAFYLSFGCCYCCVCFLARKKVEVKKLSN